MSGMNADQYPVPTAARRLMCAAYELCLLFGITFVSGYLFLSLLQWRWPLPEPRLSIYQGWIFLVIGFYFAWFWRHGGQTLAMKTWKVRLVSDRSGGISPWQAVSRYLLLWVGLLPGTLIASLSPEHAYIGLAVWIASLVLSFGWMFIDRDRQYLHDRLAGTRLISN